MKGTRWWSSVLPLLQKINNKLFLKKMMNIRDKKLMKTGLSPTLIAVYSQLEG